MLKQLMIEKLTPEQRLEGLTPEQRLLDVPPDERLLFLSDDQLRQFPEAFIDSRPAHVRERIRARLNH